MTIREIIYRVNNYCSLVNLLNPENDQEGLGLSWDYQFSIENRTL